MQVLKVLQTLEDGGKGPCWGYLKDGDVLMHVNDEPVNGKDAKEVVQQFNSSWKAVLGIIRVEGVFLALPFKDELLVFSSDFSKSKYFQTDSRKKKE